MHSRRLYRDWAYSEGLTSFTVVADETDLRISASMDLSKEALSSASRHRQALKSYFHQHPGFATSLRPQEAQAAAPDIIVHMANAARSAGIGPLSAVAGAMAEAVGRDLLQHCEEVIVENGGDIFLHSRTERTIGLYAGQSPLTGRIGLLISPDVMPVGVCTSSASVGHSLSLGSADACTVVARSTALADAFATMLCNRVRQPAALQEILASIVLPADIIGIVITFGDKLAMQGDIQLADVTTT